MAPVPIYLLWSLAVWFLSPNCTLVLIDFFQISLMSFTLPSYESHYLIKKSYDSNTVCSSCDSSPKCECGSAAVHSFSLLYISCSLSLKGEMTTLLYISGIISEFHYYISSRDDMSGSGYSSGSWTVLRVMISLRGHLSEHILWFKSMGICTFLPKQVRESRLNGLTLVRLPIYSLIGYYLSEFLTSASFLASATFSRVALFCTAMATSKTARYMNIRFNSL